MNKIIKDQINELKPSATLAINEECNKLKKKGKKIYKFGFGQSPFPVPDSVILALKNNAEKNMYLPMQGLEELRLAIANNLKKAVIDSKSGQIEIRNDKDGNIGVSIGKKSFDDKKLVKNFNAIIDALEKEKLNNTLKGDLIKQAFMTSTMGVSYKVKLAKSI